MLSTQSEAPAADDRSNAAPVRTRPVENAAGSTADRARVAESGRYDELRGSAAATEATPPMAHWREFFAQLDGEGPAGLDKRLEILRRRVRDNGITYNVHADARQGATRPWSLDLFPLLITPGDWAGIERGVLQRTRLLNAMLDDLYGPQTILRDALLPPALVTGHPGYVRTMHGVRPAGGTWLHIAAFDLARAPDGEWRLVSQRTQGPSGLGYLLENRLIVSGLFPQPFHDLRVQRLAASYRALLQSMQDMSPAGRNSRIVLLTPGPLSETYFEHAYLARYLGLTLVEGSDLSARDNRLYLKTLQGLEPVHGVLGRLDDDYLDPLELRPDSALGVPGLLQAMRAGNLLLANAPGAGFLESPGMLGFLPGLAERLLGEPLLLSSVPTWWCGEQLAFDEAMPQLAQSVIKPTYPPGVQGGGRFEPVIGGTLSAAMLDTWRARIAAQPDNYTVQSWLPFSQAPTWRSRDTDTGPAHERIVPCPATLRVFVISDGPGAWRVLPGGLTRIASPDRLSNVSMQRGGSSVDTWVMTEGAVDATTMLREHLGPDDLLKRSRTISSRAAENLFWLGRYTERSVNIARLARAALDRLGAEVDDDSTAQVLVLDALCRENRMIPADTPPASHSPREFERALSAALLRTDDGLTSVAFCLQGMCGTAAAIRERLSREQWRLIADALGQFDESGRTASGARGWSSHEALRALERLNIHLGAITGAQTDHMTRDDGWRLLSIGRQIDRLEFLGGVLATAFGTGAVHEHDGFELVLELFDSAITYRSQFQRHFDIAPLLDLLVLDADNPRSLAWVAQTLRGRLSKVERSERHELSDLARIVPEIAAWPLRELCEPGQDGLYRPLLDRLTACRDALWKLSERIGERYFSHVREAETTLWG
ncbi:circularly permuted type 2 ATP-grasp protein [Paraburkholderia dilworthii]|uniref:circularly permuted type 2 ATP-grasp protein n=1 Tax=Paraburkholderia dilworthii TaxID=948106 RepID=UPI0038B6BF08